MACCGNAAMASATRLRLRRSSCVVGSSNTTSCGAITNTDAMATNWRSPPDRVWLVRSARWPTPSRSSAAAMRASRSAGARPCFFRPNARSSRTMGKTIWFSGFWNTKPTRRRTSLTWLRVSRPSTSTRPEDGRARPLTSRASVLLPAPLGPITPTRRSDRRRLTPCRTCAWGVATTAWSNSINMERDYARTNSHGGTPS
ncbi:Protein of uncharacterised function (DUF1602) [Bordetella pertussis]|nr:Protein of uncharacterised function (DUF1602) [Bordetella pertussis]